MISCCIYVLLMFMLVAALTALSLRVKGKPVEKLGRKASGLKVCLYL